MLERGDLTTLHEPFLYLYYVHDARKRLPQMRFGNEDRTVIPSSAALSQGAGKDRRTSRGEREPHGDPAMSDDRFDALETARDLEAAGIERPHAEAIVRAVGHAVAPLATKADIQRLEATMRGDIKQHDASTKADFERFDYSMPTDFERFQATIGAEFAEFRTDMYRALWIQGAGIVAVVAALKLLP